MTTETKAILGISIVTLVIIIGAAVIFSKPTTSEQALSNQKPVSAEKLLRDDSYRTGSASAKVTVVEFGDFQCPACGAAYPVVNNILDTYKGKIQYVFRNFPLSVHQKARPAAEAAEAAGKQGKYWDMFDKLYQNQNEWSELTDPTDTFVSYAKDLDLDIDSFKKDIQNKQFEKKINRDYTDGTDVGVNATPTFFINGIAYVGVPGADFRSRIDTLLKK